MFVSVHKSITNPVLTWCEYITAYHIHKSITEDASTQCEYIPAEI